MGPMTETALKKLMVAADDSESDFDATFKSNGQFSTALAKTYLDGAKEAGTTCGTVVPPSPDPTPNP